jgi:hypothetical protein
VTTVVGYSSEMSQVVLIHPVQSFKVSTRLIVLKCGLFADNPSLTTSPYAVRSQVSLEDFREFVSALEGHAIKIKKDNIKGLSALCGEFGFRDLGARLSTFRDLGDFKEAETIKVSEARRLSVLEERVQQRGHELASLHCKLMRQLQAQESATEAILGRVSQLEADRGFVGSLSTEVARLKEAQSVLSGEVDKVRQQLRTVKKSADNAKDIGLSSRAVAEESEKRVAEVRSEVETHRNALKEVRNLAEGAQTKSESAEAQLGRVGRLEAEVLALRTATVGEIRSEIGNPRMRLRELTNPEGWNSAIVPDFPKLFEAFKDKQFTLLWRGHDEGFRAWNFHYRCDGCANTLTVILDRNGNIFGGFTPVEWETRTKEPFFKADPSQKSFLFPLKNHPERESRSGNHPQRESRSGS